MTIKNNFDKWLFVFLVTAASVAASLLLVGLFTEHGLEPEFIGPTILVPMIIAPIATLWMAKMMLRIHALNQQLQFLVQHDQMTGLLNRGAFFERVEGKHGAVMMLDIDRFKAINDTHGHNAGDLIIRQVASILKEKSEPAGAAARFGGEEFMTFYPDECLAHAELRAEAIRSAVESQSVLVSGKTLSCTLSIGVDVFDGSRPLDEVLSSADAALYRAKISGRNRIESHETAVQVLRAR